MLQLTYLGKEVRELFSLEQAASLSLHLSR